MNEEQKNEFLKRVKIINGGVPNVKTMRNTLPRRFKEMKIRLGNVGKIKCFDLEEANKTVNEFMQEYGTHLEEVYFLSSDEVKKLYLSMNKLERRIQNIEQIKRSSVQIIGKIPGE